MQPSRYSVKALYVPTRSYYVPIRSAYLFKDFLVKLYVPIRSVQQYRRSATQENEMSKSGLFSYRVFSDRPMKIQENTLIYTFFKAPAAARKT